MKAHLLHPDQDFDFTAELPPNSDDLIQDLELGTVLAAMAAGDKFLLDISQRVLLTSVADVRVIRYRQDILADCIAAPEIIRDMYRISVAALQDKRGVWGFLGSRYPGTILAGAINQLEVLIARLRELRRVADGHAGKFSSEGLSTLLRGLQSDLDDDYFATLRRHLGQLRFRNGELLSAQLDRGNTGISYVLRSGDARRSWKERLGIEPRSSYSFTIPPRDEAGAEALQDIANRGINLVANAAAQSADHVTSYFIMLRAELGFYVSCLSLHEQLAARNQPTAFPAPADASLAEFSCTDLRDTSLALQAGHAVGNDIDGDGKMLLIITGANSGGKSTFLRSAGLAQLMMQCGMFVTARALRSSVCQKVFTHFIREEDPAMISGRLDEELKRLSVIADQLSPRCLILFNESFAATNEREGSEIGRQVVRALLEAGIRVFFVTHHYDLADSFYRERPDAALFLRAPRQADGQRTFKLAEARPLPTSYGQDIYYRIGGWLAEQDDAPSSFPPPAHP
ncbi:MAG: MutS-related protein [Streptosporangiaceae bacterium]